MEKSIDKVDLVYMIDDDSVIIYLTELIIKTVDFCKELKTFTKGEDALNTIREAAETGSKLPDLLLIDLNMPIFNGWHFLDALQEIERAKDIPVFVFTSSIDPRDIEKSKTYPSIKDYIVKPLTIHKINKILRYVI